jgi:hypothetical protein
MLQPHVASKLSARGSEQLPDCGSAVWQVSIEQAFGLQTDTHQQQNTERQEHALAPVYQQAFAKLKDIAEAKRERHQL